MFVAKDGGEEADYDPAQMAQVFQVFLDVASPDPEMVGFKDSIKEKRAAKKESVREGVVTKRKNPESFRCFNKELLDPLTGNPMLPYFCDFLGKRKQQILDDTPGKCTICREQSFDTLLSWT